MKFSTIVIIIALLALAVTAAFAKEDTLHKEYVRPTHVASAAQQAKAMHQHKMLRLHHPEKMAKLQKRYDAMRGHQQGLSAKAGFVRKAQMHAGYKHDCPYHHGMPNTAAPMHGAKQMHAMKCGQQTMDCCK